MGKQSKRRLNSKKSGGSAEDQNLNSKFQGTNQADQYTLHKREFDRIIAKYKLHTEEKSEEIAEFLTSRDSENKVSAPNFAEKFGMTVEEAVVFLEWIKVGVKFKEEAIDTAKKAGLGKKS